jgi:autotransporter-associated beta strand protein
MRTGSQRGFAQDVSRLQFRSKARSLLNSTALIPVVGALAAASVLALPGVAHAQSTGGDGGGNGGAGGVTNTNPGGTGGAGVPGGAPGSGGGGGGAGETGGTGGTGQGSGGGAGGGEGQNGRDATEFSSGGGGGGGGRLDVIVDPLPNSTFGSFTGQAGGNGGVGGIFNGSGGGGGAGGGLVVISTVGTNYTLGAGITVRGGAGGNGGSGGGFGTSGGGGDGGTALDLRTAGTFTVAGSLLGGLGGSGLFTATSGDGGVGLNFSGGTLVTSGLIQGGNGGVGSIPGAGGIGLIGAGLTINNTGTISGGLGGDGVTRALALRLSGTNTILNIGTLTGGVEIASGTTIFDIATDQALANVISGAGALTKAGAGNLTLSGANTYTGLTTVSAGTLTVANSAALGSGDAGTVVSAGATLALQGGVTLNETLTLNGNGVNGGGALRSTSALDTIVRGDSSKLIALGAATKIVSLSELRINADINTDGHELTFDGPGETSLFGNVLGGGGITYIGNGRLSFDLNTVSGVITLNAQNVDPELPGRGINLFGSGNNDAARLVLTRGRLFVGADNRVGSLEGGSESIVTAINPALLTVGGNNDSTLFEGRLINRVGLTKVGTGTLTLTGENTNNVSTTPGGISTRISGGTLQIGNGGTTGTLGGGSVLNNATLAFNRSNDITVSNAISGSGALTKLGAGRLTLTGASTYSGRTTIEQGTLQVNTGSALGTGAVVFAGGALRGGANVSLDNDLTINRDTNAVISAAASTTLTLTGNEISDSNNGVTRFGTATDTGTVTLAFGQGAPSSIVIVGNGRAISIDGGTLHLASAAARSYFSNIGSFGSGGGVNVDGTLELGGGGFSTTINQLSGSGTINSGSGAAQLVTQNTLANTTFAGVLQDGVGALSLTHNGGSLTLSGTNTYTGTTTVSAGTLRVANASALGATSAVTTVEAGATVEIEGDIAVAEAFNIAGNGVGNGGAIRIVSGAPSLNGAIFLTADARINTDSSGVGGFPAFITGSINSADRNLTVGGSGILAMTGGINLSNGTLIKDGTGQIAIAGNNIFTALIINGGVLQINGGSAIQDGAQVTIAGGGTLLVAASETIAGLAGDATGVVQIDSGQTLTVGSSNTSSTFAGRITNLGALTKTGTGTQTLTGNNIYQGTTRISGGTLQIGDGGTSGTLGMGEVSIDSGAFLTFNRSNNHTVANVISGRGSLVQSGPGTLRLTGVNTYSGGTFINSGTIVAGNASALGTGTTLLNASGTKLIADFDGTLTRIVHFGSGVDATFAAANGRSAAIQDLVIGADTTARFGSATESGTIVWDVGRVQVVNPGTSSVVIDGGTVRLSSRDVALFTFDFITQIMDSFEIAQAATLDTNGNSVVLGRLTGTGTVANTGAANTLTLGNGSGFGGTFDTGANGITLAGSLAGLGGFTKTGTGTLTLASGLDTTGFNGGLTLAGGTLSLQGSLGAGFGTITTTGSVIDYADGITSAAPIAINSNTTQLQVLTGTATQSGVISEIGGPRGFEKIGDGTLVLGGANTYSGLTTISGGVLSISSGGNLGDGSATNGLVLNGGTLRNTSAFFTNRDVTVSAAGGSVDASGTLVLGGGVTFGGQLVKTGGAFLNLTAAGTGAGGIALNEGTIGLSNAAGMGTGRLTMATGTTLFLQLSGLSIGNDIELGGGGGSNIDPVNNVNPTTFTGVLSGGQLNIVGGLGTAVLTNTNTYGATTIASGNRLQIGNGGETGTLGTGAVTNNGALVFNRSNDFAVANVIGGTGTLTKRGAGNLTLSVGNSYAGATVVEAGTLTINNVLALGDFIEGVTVLDGATLALSTAFSGFTTRDTITINGSGVNGGGALRNVSGNNTFTGGIVLGSDATITVAGVRLNIAVGNVDGGGNDLTLDTANGARLGVTSRLLNLGSLTKVGEGVVELRGAGGNVTGPITINAGSLQLQTSGNALDPLTSVTINGGFLQVFTNQTIGSVGGAGILQVDQLAGVRARLTTGGDNQSTTLSGQFLGRGELVKVGTGTMTLTGSNAFNGTYVIDAGTLQIGNGGGSGTLSFSDQTDLVTINGAGTLAFNRTGTETVNRVIAGSGTLRHIGAGTTILGAVNTFTGTTLVEAGTLRVDGELLGTITVSGGTLGGSGTLGAVTVGSGGKLAAGQSPGTMTVASLTLNAGSETIFELAAAGVAGGPSNDLIRVTGNLALNGGAISVVRGTGFSAGQYTLFEFGTLTGALTNLTINPLGGGFGGNLALGTNTVLLNVAGAADQVHWNGSTFAPAGSIVGGSGTWDLLSGNFSNAAGTVSGPWAGNGSLAIFGGTSGGTVTIAADTVLSPSGLNFDTTGYTIAGANAGSRLAFNGPSGINTATGVSAAINVVIEGSGSVTKTGGGTLTLNAVNTYTGDTNILGGTLVNNGTIAGAVINSAALTSTGTLLGQLTNNAGATASLAGTSAAITNSGTLNVTGDLDIQGVLTNEASGTVTIASGLTEVNSAVVNRGTASDAFTINGQLSTIAEFENRTQGQLLVAAGGSLSATLGVNNATGATIENDGTIAGLLRNTGTLISTGTLSNLLVNNFGGAATLSGNVADVTNSGSLTLTGTLNASGALGSLTMGRVTVASGANASFAGDISNSGVAANAFTINGSLSTSGRFNNQFGGNLLVAAGGSLTATLGVNNATGGTINNVGTIASAVTNNGGFTSTGTLSALLLNNGGGGVSLSGNVADVTNFGTLSFIGNTSGSGQLVHQTAAAMTVDAGITVNFAGNVSNFGAGLVTVNGTLTSGGLLLNSDGSTMVVGTTGTVGGTAGMTNASGGTLTNNGTIASYLNNFGDFTSTGTLAAGFLNGAGSAVANLSGQVNGEVRNFGTINLIGTTTGIGNFENGANAVFNLNGFNTTIGSLTDSGTINLGTATLTVGGNNTSTSFGGVINGTGGLIKAGAGTLTLTGIHAYTGETRVDEGGLSLATNGVIAGAVRNSGSFTNSGTVNGLVTNLGTLSSTGTIGGGLTMFAGSTGTVSGTLNGEIRNGGALTVNGNLASNNFGQTSGDSTTTILAGARWSGMLGFSNLSTSGNGVVIAGTLDVSGIVSNFGGATMIVASGGTLTAQNMANLGTVSNGGTVNTDITNSGAITNSGVWNGTLSQGTGSVTNSAGATWNGNFLIDAGGLVTNSGTWDNSTQFLSAVRNGSFSNRGTLTGLGVVVTGPSAVLSNDIGATITLDAGASLRVGDSGRIDNFGTVSALGQVDAGGVLRNFAGASWSGNITIAAGGSVSNGGTITGNIQNAGSFASLGTVNGDLTNAAGSTATLAGTFNGDITNSGRVQLVGTTTGIDLFSQMAGGVFELSGFNTTIGGLSGAGRVELGSANLTVNAAAPSSFGGVITGTGGLIKLGAQTLTLSGANTFTGATVINAGTLVLNGALAGTVLNNASFTNNGTVTGLVTNNGTLASIGFLNGGLTNNAGASASLRNVVRGAITNAGIIRLTGNFAGEGALSQMAGGVFDVAGFNASLGSIAGAGSIALGTGVLAVGDDDSSTTFGGVIGGSGLFIKSGTGTLTLTGLNTLSGETEVAEGTLVLAAGGGIAGRVRNSGATFSNAGTVDGLVINTGTLTSTGSLLGGLNQTAAGSAAVSGVLNGTITNAGALVVDGNLASNGALTNTGTGTVQVLSGARWSGLTGIDNASTNATGFTIAGELVTGGVVINRAGATLAVGLGATLQAGNMANFGTVTSSGTVTSDVTNAGTLDNGFIWNGNLSQGTGSAISRGLWNGAFLIDAGGVVTNIGRWDNNTDFLSAINNGLFENFGLLRGGGVNVTGADARFVNRAGGGTVTLDTGAALRADNGGIITNAGAITANGEANANGVIENRAGASWTGLLSVAATGSLTNTGTITGDIVNSGTFFSNDTVRDAR